MVLSFAPGNIFQTLQTRELGKLKLWDAQRPKSKFRLPLSAIGGYKKITQMPLLPAAPGAEIPA